MTLAIDIVGKSSCYGNFQTKNTIIVRGYSEEDTATPFFHTVW
jgi:hypothetical protein